MKWRAANLTRHLAQCERLPVTRRNDGLSRLRKTARRFRHIARLPCGCLRMRCAEEFRHRLFDLELVGHFRSSCIEGTTVQQVRTPVESACTDSEPRIRSVL